MFDFDKQQAEENRKQQLIILFNKVRVPLRVNNNIANWIRYRNSFGLANNLDTGSSATAKRTQQSPMRFAISE